jgi:hypothetical protein
MVCCAQSGKRGSRSRNITKGAGNGSCQVGLVRLLPLINDISHALQAGSDHDIGLGQFKDAIPSRQLILALLTELWNMGWTLETAQPVFLYSENRDSMFFKQVLPRPAAPRQFFAIGIAESDKLRVYNWPNDEVDKAIAYVLRVGRLR